MSSDFSGQILQVIGKTPQIASDVYIAPNSYVIGDVEIGEKTSVWFNCTLRGDVNKITIGKNCNIQDGTIIHGMYQQWSVTLEDNVSIGHGVILHGCHIGEGSLVGMGSILMDGSKIGKNSIVAAGSLVTEGTEIPDGWVAMGRPAVPKRELNDREKKLIASTTEKYLMYKDWFTEEEK